MTIIWKSLEKFGYAGKELYSQAFFMLILYGSGIRK